MTGPNRVVIGLPGRYEKAKAAISTFEARQRLIRDIIHDPTIEVDGKLAIINLITWGHYDDPPLDLERD